MKKVILAYVPVLHAGYREFFLRHSAAQTLYVLGQSLIDEFAQLQRDIRALSPDEILAAVVSWNIIETIYLATPGSLVALALNGPTVVMPDEDVSHELATRYLTGCRVEFDRVFLRWDAYRSAREDPVEYDRCVSFDGLVGEMMSRAMTESTKSSDWWRQVGAVIARNGEVLMATHNRHVPSPHMPYVDGDPRANFSRGVNIELSTAHHAEARLIAEAARKGIALEGTDLYVTTFPCPLCAKQVAYAGIKRLFFRTGYAVLDGERILRSQGVEIILVQ